MTRVFDGRTSSGRVEQGEQSLDAGSTDTVLTVRDLEVSFAGETGSLRAVRGISFDLHAGESLAIVGESGAGKSATSLAIMGLLPATAHVRGSISLRGEALLGRDDDAMSGLRGRSMAMVFQDPLSALTPVYTIGDQIVEAIRVHQKLGRQVALRRAIELLDLVGIPEPRRRAHAFPHEFSGGMRQRAMIAMAIANDPDVIIADEPTTALDVTIQAQILEVLRTARDETGAGLLLITHDLGVVAGVADTVSVMYAGRVVEQGITTDIFHRPCMPYTVGLLGSIPRTNGNERVALATMEGSPPSLLAPSSGCPFAPRCPLVSETCRQAEPALAATEDADHLVACIHADTIASGVRSRDDLFTSPLDYHESRLLDGATASARSDPTDMPGDATRLDRLNLLTEGDVARPDRSSYKREGAATRQDSLECKHGVVLKLVDMALHYPLLEGAIFRRRMGTVFAVDGIDLELRKGETLGLVGESGCGKSTTVRAIMELQQPTRGSISVLGSDVARLQKRAQRREMRRHLQVVFQDPMASLDPRMPVFDLIAEPLGVFGIGGERLTRRVDELLVLVGLDASHLDRYPLQLSGGQRQRVGIARALALEPAVLILDEPVSALDVSIRAGIVNLLDSLKARLGLSYLFVAHDLAIVRHIADRVAVMYLGVIVETGTVAAVYAHPVHPYTRALLSAMPIPDPDAERGRRRILLEGELPSPSSPPSGCRFHTRCPKKQALGVEEQSRCVTESPPLVRVEMSEANDGGDAERVAVRNTTLTGDTTISAPTGEHASACHFNDRPWPMSTSPSASLSTP